MCQDSKSLMHEVWRGFGVYRQLLAPIVCQPVGRDPTFVHNCAYISVALQLEGLELERWFQAWIEFIRRNKRIPKPIEWAQFNPDVVYHVVEDNGFRLNYRSYGAGDKHVTLVYRDSVGNPVAHALPGNPIGLARRTWYGHDDILPSTTIGLDVADSPPSEIKAMLGFSRKEFITGNPMISTLFSKARVEQFGHHAVYYCPAKAGRGTLVPEAKITIAGIVYRPKFSWNGTGHIIRYEVDNLECMVLPYIRCWLSLLLGTALCVRVANTLSREPMTGSIQAQEAVHSHLAGLTLVDHAHSIYSTKQALERHLETKGVDHYADAAYINSAVQSITLAQEIPVFGGARGDCMGCSHKFSDYSSSRSRRFVHRLCPDCRAHKVSCAADQMIVENAHVGHGDGSGIVTTGYVVRPTEDPPTKASVETRATESSFQEPH